MAVQFHDLLMAPLDVYGEAVGEGEEKRFAVPAYRDLGWEGSTPTYAAGVLEIDTERGRSVFFDLADYEQRRSRRGNLSMIRRLTYSAAAVVVAASIAIWMADVISPADFFFSIGAVLVLLLCLLPLLIMELRTRRDLEGERAVDVEVPPQLLTWLDGVWSRIASGEAYPLRGQDQSVADSEQQQGVGQAMRDGFKEGVAEATLDQVIEGAGQMLGEHLVALVPSRRELAKEQRANLSRLHAAWGIVRYHERLTGRSRVGVGIDEWRPDALFNDERFRP